MSWPAAGPVGRAPRQRRGRCGHQGLWLDGDAAQAVSCDAAIAPVVTGDVNPGAFGDLVRLCTELGRFRPHGTPAAADSTGRNAAPDGPDAGDCPGGPGPGDGADGPGPGDGADGPGTQVPAGFGGGRSREALEQAIIGKAILFSMHSYQRLKLRRHRRQNIYAKRLLSWM
jgi:hypothetical protein